MFPLFDKLFSTSPQLFLIASPASNATNAAVAAAKGTTASTPADTSNSDADDELDSVDTVETPLRWLGLLGRVRTVVTAQSRLLAYTSEIGEAFRPVATPFFVTGAYAVSWAYVIGDVGFEAYKMRHHGANDIDVVRTGVERGIFQTLASMVFPAYTVHWVVHQASNSLRKAKPSVLKAYGPTGLGLACIPFLPLIFDKPVEDAVEFAFNAVWPLTEEGKKAHAQLRKLHDEHHPSHHHKAE
ncbi:hypothetical protein HDU78_001154 [Chytriomyces hyalinus]|nr:hypothetical protein HDU78_001154 [Chytriomyces hyalinus]